MLLLPLALAAGCGDGGEDERAAAERAAARPVEAAQLPQLHRCLGELSRQLREADDDEAPSLVCLVGSYRGKSGQGEPCDLQINAPQRLFTLQLGARRIALEWAPIAVDALGRPVHNLEAADLDERRPGVQLRRFSAVPEPITETLALQAGLPQAGPLGLPQIRYIRVQAGRAETWSCNFGA
ncbi:hypothetical protein [Roseateles violae]|uniref:Lipoprotein n=1 Tax=Roseateles violae TaxID=3058042 RepID=A0ABT8DR33_9BURK|nr:hypothetical protein [Pelomonas sp. PFR6]MDN3920814.1 hypothetical protein [Pelomonas sp. PFR6]